jgi:hypothetical protein
MATEVTLDRFQRWMQAVILQPGNDEEALSSNNAQREIPMPEAIHMTLPSRTLSSSERLGIYREMYFLRLVEVLKIDFEAVSHFLGNKGFDDLVYEYLQAHPSRSFNPNRLSDHMPDFIRTQANVPKREFLSDLARLELAIAQVMEEMESPVLTSEAIESVPPEQWATARLKPIHAFRLLSFRYPANAYYQAFNDEVAAPQIRRRDGWLAVYRNDYTIWRAQLTQPAHDLLALLASGAPLGEAVITIINKYPRQSDTWSKKLFQWFSGWVADGIFQAIELS